MSILITCLSCPDFCYPVPAIQPASDTKFDNYVPKVAFFFPGQGAQTVGMAQDVAAQVPAAKELFDRASEILGYDLLKMCGEGPKDKLDSTAISQPAIYVASLAAIEKLKAEQGDVRKKKLKNFITYK